MSLIHKALKKAEDGAPGPVNPAAPSEEFVGEKPKSQFTPRTIVLMVLLLGALVFTIYKKVHVEVKSPPTPVLATVPVIEPKAQTETGDPSQMAPIGEQDFAKSNAASLAEEGKKLYLEGRYDGALAKLVEANTMDPQNPEVLNNIGLTYKKKNDLAKAEESYKKALQLKPDYPECLNNIGVLKASAKNVLEASHYLKRAVSVLPTYADAYFNLAVLNEGEGNWREAIENYKGFLKYTDTQDQSLVSKIKERIEELSE